MKVPEITVLMAVFNGERFLKESVNSILNQSYSDFEFLIVNDGSTDSTATILKNYSDPRLRVIENEKNIGLAGSLNRGLTLASGKYVARIDADDICPENRLEIQCQWLKRHPELGVVSSWVEVIDEKGRVTDWWCEPLSSEDIFYLLHFRNCLSHSSVMFRKDLVLSLNGYNTDIAALEDFELWTRLSRQTKFWQVRDFLLKWRKTQDSISSVHGETQSRNLIRVVGDRLEKLMGSRFDERMISLLQHLKPNAINDFMLLQEVVILLRKLNRTILSSEAEIIEKLDFKKKRLKSAMKRKEGRIIFEYFRYKNPNNLVREFWGLRSWIKVLLVREIFYAVLRKCGLRDGGNPKTKRDSCTE